MLMQKSIRLDEVKRKIKSNNYGILNREVKPSPLKLDKQRNLIEQRARQTWCYYYPYASQHLHPNY